MSFQFCVLQNLFPLLYLFVAIKDMYEAAVTSVGFSNRENKGFFHNREFTYSMLEKNLMIDENASYRTRIGSVLQVFMS